MKLKFKTKILILNLIFAILIGGIFIGKSMPTPTQFEVVTMPKMVCENSAHKIEIENHFSNLGYDEIDSIWVVDANGENWVAYYVCTCGDCYAVTIWHNKINICEQLN